MHNYGKRIWQDAIGDTLIYLCDFAEREGVSLASLEFEPSEEPLSITYGRLLHVMLKRHQGIRGYDNTNQFVTSRNTAIAQVFMSLISLTAGIGGDWNEGTKYLLTLGESVYQKVVVKRDWKLNPEGE